MTIWFETNKVIIRFPSLLSASQTIVFAILALATKCRHLFDYIIDKMVWMQPLCSIHFVLLDSFMWNWLTMFCDSCEMDSVQSINFFYWISSVTQILWCIVDEISWNILKYIDYRRIAVPRYYCSHRQKYRESVVSRGTWWYPALIGMLPCEAAGFARSCYLAKPPEQVYGWPHRPTTGNHRCGSDVMYGKRSSC